MSTSRRPGRHRLRCGMRLATRQGGAIMMFVLLSALLLAMVTLGVTRMVAGDITEGFGALEAVQAFNVAEAGAHYAIGKLQAAGSSTYAGETIIVTSGATTLGTATVTVNCIDAGNPPGGLVPPCSTSAYPAYRRIISTATLPKSGVSGGPTRTLVAMVQGVGTGGYVICGLTSVNLSDPAPPTGIHGDIGSNGTININHASGGPLPEVVADTNAPPQYTGKAVAGSTIACADGCAAMVQGGAFPNTSPLPCPSMTPPTYSPGSNPVTVPSNTMRMLNGQPGWPNFSDVTVSAGTLVGTTCTQYTDLEIPAPASGTTVVQMGTLTMGQCTRLIIITGAGNIDLRIDNSSGNLSVGKYSHFGVLPNDTQSVPSPVPAGKLRVSLNQNGTNFLPPNVIAGTYYVPNGNMYVGDKSTFNGAIIANTIEMENAMTYSDTSGGLGGGGTYSNFTTLRSWKDQ